MRFTRVERHSTKHAGANDAFTSTRAMSEIQPAYAPHFGMFPKDVSEKGSTPSLSMGVGKNFKVISPFKVRCAFFTAASAMSKCFARATHSDYFFMIIHR